MILYGASMSPFVRKTMAYLAEKGLEADIVPEGLGSKNPDFHSASPFGKIPAFRDGDFAISDSTAIITYLEAKYPEPPLIPASPESRARTVWYEEFADSILVGKLGVIFFNRVVLPRFMGKEGDLAAAAKAETEDLPPLLDYLEGNIPKSGFLVDDRLTLADLAVASPFVNMDHSGIELDWASHPKPTTYVNAILARPSFAPIVAREKAFFAR